jgi:hypothetical protein
MSSAAAIRVMLAKGLTLEDALAVVEAFEEQSPVDNRTANARRQARFREAKRNAKALQSVTPVTPPDRNENNAKPLQSVTIVTPLARVEDNSTTIELAGKFKLDNRASNEALPPQPKKRDAEIVDWFEGQWNALARTTGLVSIRAMTEPRARAICCRADDLVHALGFADPRSGFVETFNRIRGSPFLRGSSPNGGRSWKCDVDWLLTERNFLKVHEGNYAKDQGPNNRR